MILTAAGLAVEGMHVFVSASASFLVGRGYEQIRSAVAIPGLPVKMAGTHCLGAKFVTTGTTEPG